MPPGQPEHEQADSLSKTRTAVVTGASSGIGLGIATHLAQVGWHVVGIDIAPSSYLAQRGLHLIVGDVSERATHERAAEMVSDIGQLDAWINCAGVSDEVSIHQTSADHLNRVLAVNLVGTFWGCSVAVEYMVESGGSIVNISSGQALRGRDRNPSYAASKGGVLALTTQVAAEFADRQIRCNAILPGVIDTAMNRRLMEASEAPEELKRAWDSLSPVGRMGTVEDVAEMTEFLIGPNSTFITGAQVPVDGGQLVLPPDHALIRGL